MIENVGRRCPELENQPFRDVQILHQGKIKVGKSLGLQSVYSGVAKPSSSFSPMNR
jgi:hypothetical protein